MRPSVFIGVGAVVDELELLRVNEGLGGVELGADGVAEIYLYAVVPGFSVEGMATEIDGLDAAGTVEGGGRIDLLGVGVVLVVGNG